MNLNKKASHQTMKKSNREMILQTLRAEPAISRADIAKITKLSRPTVSSIISELISEGLVTEIGSGNSKGGRKPILLQYNATYQYVVGALLENNQISLRLANLDGETIDEIIFEIELPNTIQEIFKRLSQGILHFYKNQHVMQHQLLGMVFGVPGISKNRSKNFLHSPAILYESEKDIEESIQEFPIPIHIENDVNLMAIGEYSKVKIHNYHSLLYIFAGLGIGSGLIMDGILQRGAHQAAGEIGSMLIGNPELVLPNMGVFESNFGALGISRKLNIPNSILAVDYMISSLSEKKVNDFYQKFKEHWHASILSIISVVDPKVILLGGDLIKLPPDFLEELKHKCETHLPMYPTFMNASYCEKVGLIGAVELALESFSIYGNQTIKQKGEVL
jgi:predicted NBD/HSP70 family sugar kinase